MTFWWFLFGVFFFCDAQVKNNNDWAHWADWKQWMSANNAGTDDNQKNHYYNSYGNWKHWVEHAQGGGGNTSPYGVGGGQGGSPWSTTPYGGGGNQSPHGNAGGGNSSPYGQSGGGGNTSPHAGNSPHADATKEGPPKPSKENFDSWRKWNLQKEGEHGDNWKDFGRWQLWAEQNGEGDHAANLSFEDWNNKDKVQPQQAFDPQTLDTIVVLQTTSADGHSGKRGHDGHDGSKHGHDGHDGSKHGHDGHDGSKHGHDGHDGSKHGKDGKDGKDGSSKHGHDGQDGSSKHREHEPKGQAKEESELHLSHKSSENQEAARKAEAEKNDKESFEQWIKRNKYVSDRETSSNDGSKHHKPKSAATHHEEVTEKTWEHVSNKADEHEAEREHASGSEHSTDKMSWESYAQGWQKYIPGSGGAKDGVSTAGGDWGQYIPQSAGQKEGLKGTTNKEGHYSEGGDWNKYVPESFRSSIDQGVMGGQGAKGGASKPQEAASMGDWSKYMNMGGQGAQGAQGGAQGGAGDWSKYMNMGGQGTQGGAQGTQGGAQGGAGDWSKYMNMGGQGTQGGAESTQGGAQGASGGGDWDQYVPQQYRTQGQGGKGAYSPQTLVAPVDNGLPKPGYGLKQGSENGQIDWKKYVPEAYLHFIPSDEELAAQRAQQQNQDHNKLPQPEHSHQSGHGHKLAGAHPNEASHKNGDQPESEYPWRDTVPGPYRHNVPDKDTISRIKADEKRRNFPPMMNAAAFTEPETTSYGMGWIAVGLCLAVVLSTFAYAYKRYSKRLEYDNLKDTRIARSEATDVDHLLLV